MQGVCIESGASINLKQGEKYFLFSHGKNHYYVSRFNNKVAYIEQQLRYMRNVEKTFTKKK